MAYRDPPQPPGKLSWTTGWIGDTPRAAAAVGMLIAAIGALVIRSRHDRIELVCDAATCTFRGRTELAFQRDARLLVGVVAREAGGNAVEGTYGVALYGSTNATIGTGNRANAEAIKAAILDGKPHRETYSIATGDELGTGVIAALFGIALVAVYAARLGRYRVILDVEADELRTVRAGGLGPAANACVRLSTVEAVRATAVRPDHAFSRYQVVARMKGDLEEVLVPLELRASEARAIAERVDALVEEARLTREAAQA